MSYQFKTAAQLTLIAAAVMLSTSAMAQSAGDNIVSAGWFHIAPKDSSTPLSITSPAVGPLPGSGASVDKADTLGLSFSHFFTDNWAASLDLGIPPTYKIRGTGTLSQVGQLGEAKQLAPTLLAKYFFNDANATWRPFVGLGYSHVSYTNVSLTNNFQGAIGQEVAMVSGGQLTAGSTSASLNSSWSPVVNVGLSYAINKQWYAGLSVSYVKMKTTADLSTSTNAPGVSVASTTTIKIDPIVTFLTVGYRF